jgi:hypothetical protein
MTNHPSIAPPPPPPDEEGGTGAEFTVSVATLLVTVPELLITVTV